MIEQLTLTGLSPFTYAFVQLCGSERNTILKFIGWICGGLGIGDRKEQKLGRTLNGEILDRIPSRSFSGHIYLELQLYNSVPMEHIFYKYTPTIKENPIILLLNNEANALFWQWSWWLAFIHESTHQNFPFRTNLLNWSSKPSTCTVSYLSKAVLILL